MSSNKKSLISNVSERFMDIARRDEIGDVVATVGDAGIDAAISSGSFDGIPFIGAALGLYRAGVAMRDVIFETKVANFLKTFSEASAADRAKFFEELEAKEETQKFGLTVITLLDRAEDLEKPTIVGRVMAAAAAGHIPLKDAMRLSKIVDRAFTEDMYSLPEFVDRALNYDPTVADALFSAGLLENAGSDGGTFDDPSSGGTLYKKNRFARMLLEYGLPEHLQVKPNPLSFD